MRLISAGLFRRIAQRPGGGAASCPLELTLILMKNDSVSFKLVALVIIAGVIAAFLDSSGTKNEKTLAAKPATVATATEVNSQ